MVHATQGTSCWDASTILVQKCDAAGYRSTTKMLIRCLVVAMDSHLFCAGYMHDTHISSWARVISQGIKSTTQRLCVTPTLSTWDHAWCTGKPTEHRYMVHWEPHADAQAFIRTCWILPGMIVVILPIRKFVSHYEYYCIVNHWVVVLLTYTMQTVCPHKQVAAI